MSIDERFYQIPIPGLVYKRTHSYFREHITVTDLFHVFMGIGVGLMLARIEYLAFGILVLLLSAMYHAYAFIKGGK